MSMRAQSELDIEAIVTLLPSDEGGRSAPCASGYRPSHLVIADYLTSGEHHYPECEWLHPGESARAFIEFVSPEDYPRTMRVGQVISIREGGCLVGHAEVVTILNQILLAD